ncbi:MAG TPA: M28 family peptidase [Bryobacteraceae bacterium]|nr:M28 family peptidase [Bryobacteraceae bacterium]
MPIALFFLLLATLSAAERYRLVESPTIQGRFARVHVKNEERAAELRKVFAEAGCGASNFSEKRVLSSTLPNLVCVLPGTSERIIVVSAHMDQHGGGEGAIDNWSGAALLPSLFESLKDSPRRVTFHFIAFTDEERGLVGSREYVNRLSPQERNAILANVNIDSIGLAGRLRAEARKTDKFLLTCAAELADRIKIYVGADTMDSGYDSDATAFLNWKIPVIDFHAITRATIRLLHTKKDVRTAMDPKSYYEQYQFLAAYLAYLDEVIDLQSGARPAQR